MDREIKFRGKRVSDGKWIYGSLINNTFQTNDGKILMYIIDDDMEYDCWEHIAEQLEDYEVIPETVGQYTGLNDSTRTEEYPKGIEIYENDTVSLTGCRYDTAKIVWFDGKFELRINNNEVAWFLTETTIFSNHVKIICDERKNE